MDDDIKRLEEKIDAQRKKIDEISAILKKAQKNSLLGVVFSVGVFLIPIVGLSIYIQKLTDIIKNIVPRF